MLLLPMEMMTEATKCDPSELSFNKEETFNPKMSFTFQFSLMTLCYALAKTY